jgi:outer membrane protein
MAGRRASGVATVLGSLLLIAGASAARADTLEDAMRQALQSNPNLASARADAIADSERVVQVKADGRPRAVYSASETEFLKRSASSTLLPDRTLNADVTINVPLYRSGVVKFSAREAEARYGASREEFRSTVSSLFASVVEVYSNVLRDEAIVRAGERNVASLQVNLRSVEGRYSIGDMTVTDVSLSRARLLLAEGSLQAARAQLITSREDYVRVVGAAPHDLVDIGNRFLSQVKLDSAISEALNNNGTIRAARIRIDASQYHIRSVEGERGAQVSAFGSGDYFDNLNSVSSRSIFRPLDHGTSAQVGLTLSIPLYQGGLPASRVREARAGLRSALDQVNALEREIIAQTRSAYATWQLSLEYLDKAQQAAGANEIALKSAKAENNIGTRTLLDVLDTEREIFSNYVTIAEIRRDVSVAAFRLLALMGKADPEDLGFGNVAPERWKLPVEPRQSFSDWADGPSLGPPREPSAVSVPQDGYVRP